MSIFEFLFLGSYFLHGLFKKKTYKKINKMTIPIS